MPDERRREHGPQGRRTSQNRFPQTPGKAPGEKLLDNEILRRVAVHVDLLKNDSALICRFSLVEQGIEKHFRQDIDGLPEMGVQNSGVKAGGLSGRKRVDLPADRVHTLGEAGGRTFSGPFEEHVLYKVRAALLTAPFQPGPDAHPNTDGRAAYAAYALQCQPHSVGESN